MAFSTGSLNAMRASSSSRSPTSWCTLTTWESSWDSATSVSLHPLVLVAENHRYLSGTWMRLMCAMRGSASCTLNSSISRDGPSRRALASCSARRTYSVSHWFRSARGAPRATRSHCALVPRANIRQSPAIVPMNTGAACLSRSCSKHCTRFRCRFPRHALRLCSCADATSALRCCYNPRRTVRRTLSCSTSPIFPAPTLLLLRCSASRCDVRDLVELCKIWDMYSIYIVHVYWKIYW